MYAIRLVAMYVLRKNLEFLQHAFSCDAQTGKNLTEMHFGNSGKIPVKKQVTNWHLCYLLSFWFSRVLSINCAIYLDCGLLPVN